MKHVLFALAALLAVPAAFAQSSVGSSSGSTAIVQPGQINSPIVGVEIGGTVMPSRTRSEIDTNQAATAATVFVNPPAADTCAMAGSGVSLQLPGGGAAVSAGGSASVRCEMRADAISMKVTMGEASAAVIKARYCMDDQMAEAFARAGQPCTDARPQRTAAANEPTDPYVRQRMGLPVR